MVCAGGGLQIAFFERFAMPDAVSFIHCHMIHVDGNPHIGGGVGDMVVHSFVDEEIVCFHIAVLDVVYARILHFGKVEFCIVVLEVSSPHRGLSGEYFYF